MLSNRSWLFFIFSLILYSTQLHAIESFNLKNTNPNGVAVGRGILYFEDTNHTVTFEQALVKNDGWRLNEATIFNQGYSESSWWLKFDIENTGPATEFVMEVSYPVLDYLDVYFVRHDGEVNYTELGDKLPFNARPIDHRLFILPINLAPAENVSVYVKVRSSSSVQVPIDFWEKEIFLITDISRSVMHGVFMGGILSIAIYNLLIYLVLRDRTYLYYVGYVICMFLFLASLNGWSYQFLWPNSAHWNDTSILMSLNGVVVLAIIFCRRFLGLGKRLVLMAHSLVLLCLTCFVVFLVTPYSVGIRVIIPFAAVACFWGWASGVFALYKGQLSPVIYVLSCSGLLTGGIILALNKMQIIPRNFFTDYAVQMGTLLEVLLLSFALAERINHERTLRLNAQNHSLGIQKKANEELECRVTERTKELEVANSKLQKLSDTDQLTGLNNRRFLDIYLEKEIARGLRYQHNLAVLLIDIDHFKAVNDQYGHLTGDHCLQEVANIFSSQILRRPTDFPARYGGEEFCVVLPETDNKGAVMVANRIREHIQQHSIESRGFNGHLTVSVGVYTAVPRKNDLLNEYLERADKALYLAKANGRNRVEVYKASIEKHG